jgi:hypothetical protein
MAYWSMKVERELIRLARSNLTLDQIAAKLDMPPMAVIKAAKRFGRLFESDDAQPRRPRNDRGAPQALIARRRRPAPKALAEPVKVRRASAEN